jgi:hypothetical protein
MEILSAFVPTNILKNPVNVENWRQHNLLYEECAAPNTFPFSPQIGVARHVTSVHVRGLSLVKLLSQYYGEEVEGTKGEKYTYYASCNYVVPPYVGNVGTKRVFAFNNAANSFATLISLPPNAVIQISRGSSEAMKELLSDTGVPYGAFNMPYTQSSIIRTTE